MRRIVEEEPTSAEKASGVGGGGGVGGGSGAGREGKEGNLSRVECNGGAGFG